VSFSRGPPLTWCRKRESVEGRGGEYVDLLAFRALYNTRLDEFPLFFFRNDSDEGTGRDGSISGQGKTASIEAGCPVLSGVDIQIGRDAIEQKGLGLLLVCSLFDVQIP